MQPPVSEPNHTADPIYRALAHALAQAQARSAEGAAPFISQWLMALRHALPHPAYWEEARALLFIALEYLDSSGRLVDTLTWLKQGIEYSNRYGDAQAAATLKIELGREMVRQGDTTEAKAILEAGITYFEQEGVAYAPALNAFSYLALSRGNTQEAEALAQQALDALPREAGAWFELGQSYRNLGTAAHQRKEAEQALHWFKESARWWDMGNSPRYHAFGLVNIASALRPLERYNEAEHLYREAITIFEKVGDPVNRAYAQLNLGNIFLKQEMWDAAIDQYYAAEQVLAHLQQKMPLALLYPNWALAYLGMQKYEAARRAAERSIEIFTEMENRRGRANSLDILGLALQGLGRYDGARATYLQALEDLREIPDAASLVQEVYTHLAALEDAA